jgi:cation diffusion facilitator CzcD-associated flavoprotein CzcO
MTAALRGLSERVQRDLALLSYPARSWVRARQSSAGQPIHDVLIVGAGQSGLVAAFALARERVDNVLVVDENPLDCAGPWLSFARMRSLRTPKYLTGPDLGIPSLTPRAFYEAQHGEGSWERLAFLPKETWAAYLQWYRETLRLPVRPETRIGALRWDAQEQAFCVPCQPPGPWTQQAPGVDARAPNMETLLARRVVLATGIQGSGAWHVPAAIRDALPRERYAHTAEPIDFAALRGRRVAVLGAGASAFDNAATALEEGAREVHLFFRRRELVSVNPYRWAEFVGFLKHFGDLTDAQKWRFVSQIVRMGQLPPRDTYLRASGLPGFHLHPDSGATEVEARADGIVVRSERGALEADFLIVGTGFVTDLSLRPELALLEADIARWQDRYVPEAGEQHEELSRHPYLGSHFEFTERVAGSAPWLAYLYNYTFGGLLSLGFGGASISGMKYSVKRLVDGITGSLFLEDSEHHYESLCAFAEREF